MSTPARTLQYLSVAPWVATNRIGLLSYNRRNASRKVGTTVFVR